MPGNAPYSLPASTLCLPAWPTDVDDCTWRALFGRSPGGVFVLVDSQLAESHGQLRALPFLRALGIERFSFVDSWRGLSMVPFEWYRIAEDTRPRDLINDFPICQLVSQEIEDRSPSDATYKLLRAREMAGPGALLVFVFDTTLFARRQDIQVRPFVDEYDLRMPQDYAAYARSYLARNPIAHEQPLLSLNLAWQGLAAFRHNATPARHLEEILNPRNHRAGSPIWEWYEHLCDFAGPTEDADLIRQALRRWIDVDVSRAVDQVILSLQRFNFSRQQVIRQRQEQEKREHQDTGA